VVSALPPAGYSALFLHVESLVDCFNPTKEIPMSHNHAGLIAEYRERLVHLQYSPMVVHNYSRNADQFLSYLEGRKIALEQVTPEAVSKYLVLAVRRFRGRHGRAPAQDWISIPRSGIHGLLKLALKSWPPERIASTAGESLCQNVCNQYRTWLHEERGLARASIDALLWEARKFCTWHCGRADSVGFAGLSSRDIDAYFETLAPGLRRKSLKDVAERLRSFLRNLHRAGHIQADLASRVIAPSLYAYETIPSILSPDQIAAILQSAGKDRSPIGLRDYAILRLLATYGLRAGEIARLQLSDVDWHAETLSIHHTKTGSRTLLPLMDHVGDALLQYLRHGRPKTAAVRTIFIRTRAPYERVSSTGIYSGVRRRMEAAGVRPVGKRGPHLFRHARAVSMLRASIPRKVIGDVLGHRSTEATIPYLKLATEDLRSVALDVPEYEVRL
jgi:integrase/recombinase XerD